MNYSRQQVLALVEASPAAVAAHARADWLGLFGRVHVVEDPVGSSPHVGGLYDPCSGQRGAGALGRFYDTFIAPNQIRFDVKRDLVCGLHMVRDLDIEIRMSPEVLVRVPMHLLYELALEQDGLRIQRLAAHWELGPMLGELMRWQPAYLKVIWGNNLRLLRNMGVRGLLGFSRALFNVGRQGRNHVQALLRDMQGGDAAAIAKACPGVLLAGTGQRLGAGEAAALLRDLHCGKLLVAGDVVSASLDLRDGRSGVAFFYMARRPLRVLRCELYLDGANHG